jgi:cytochrome c oxidase assembly factor CtaG
VFVPDLWRSLGVAVPVDTSWTFAPIVLVALVAYVWVYAWRWRISRAEGGPRAASVGRLLLWCGGVLSLFVALISPVDRLGEQLASVHMVQHLLIADLAPILLTLGLTKWILRPATRRIHRIERAAGPFGHPVFGVVAYVGAMWLWHIPAMYDAALRHSGIHALEHICFFTGGVALWWPLIQPVPMRRRLTGLGILAYLLVAKISVGALGIALTWSHGAAYSYYEHVPRIWGLTAREDQNLGGAIMMVEQSLVLVIAFAVLFIRMLLQSEEDERRRERFEDAAAASR